MPLQGEQHSSQFRSAESRYRHARMDDLTLDPPDAICFLRNTLDLPVRAAKSKMVPHRSVPPKAFRGRPPNAASASLANPCFDTARFEFALESYYRDRPEPTPRRTAHWTW